MKGIKKLIGILFLIILITICVVTYNGYKLYKDAINDMSIDAKIESIKSKNNYIDISQIPQDLKNATIAIEDHRFYDHGAIDIFSIVRATFKNIKDMNLSEGGSTITQQLAKNMYFSQEKKFERKIAEIFVSFDLENKISKDEILGLYLNVIYYGDGYTGVVNASKGYFNKEPNKLTLNEMTILAGLPNAPSAYALSSNPELAKERQYMVLDAMYLYNYIDKETLDSLKK